MHPTRSLACSSLASRSVVRLHRVLRRGHGLLVGLTGTGRSTLARVAAFCAGATTESEGRGHETAASEVQFSRAESLSGSFLVPQLYRRQFSAPSIYHGASCCTPIGRHFGSVGLVEARQQLKTVLLDVGTSSSEKQAMWLLTETSVADEAILEDVNSLVNTGNVTPRLRGQRTCRVHLLQS